ncbi:hypothetical protein D3C81_1145050 [compost metagenome]
MAVVEVGGPDLVEALLEGEAMHLGLAVVPVAGQALLAVSAALGEAERARIEQLVVHRLVLVQRPALGMVVAQAGEGVAVVGVVVVAVVVGVAGLAAGVGGEAAAQLLEHVAAVGFQVVAALAGFHVGLVAARGAGDDVDHPADRLVAVQHGAGTPQDLDALDVGQRHAVEIGTGQCRLVEAAAVDQDQRVVHRVLAEAAQAGGGAAAVADDVAQLHAGLAAQHVLQVLRTAALDLRTLDDPHAGRSGLLQRRGAGDDQRQDVVGGRLGGQTQAGSEGHGQGQTGKLHQEILKSGRQTFEEGRNQRRTGEAGT